MQLNVSKVALVAVRAAAAIEPSPVTPRSHGPRKPLSTVGGRTDSPIAPCWQGGRQVRAAVPAIPLPERHSLRGRSESPGTTAGWPTSAKRAGRVQDPRGRPGRGRRVRKRPRPASPARAGTRTPRDARAQCRGPWGRVGRGGTRSSKKPEEAETNEQSSRNGAYAQGTSIRGLTRQHQCSERD